MSIFQELENKMYIKEVWELEQDIDSYYVKYDGQIVCKVYFVDQQTEKFYNAKSLEIAETNPNKYIVYITNIKDKRKTDEYKKILNDKGFTKISIYDDVEECDSECKCKKEVITDDILNSTRNENQVYYRDEIQKVLPADKYGIQIQLTSSKGKTKWLTLNVDSVAVLEDFLKKNFGKGLQGEAVKPIIDSDPIIKNIMKYISIPTHIEHIDDAEILAEDIYRGVVQPLINNIIKNTSKINRENTKIDAQTQYEGTMNEATNDDVIDLFINDNFPHDEEEAKKMGIGRWMSVWGAPNLKITKEDNGWSLVNYDTPILFRDNDGKLYFNSDKYTVTTSKIQNQIRRALGSNDFDEVGEEIIRSKIGKGEA